MEAQPGPRPDSAGNSGGLPAGIPGGADATPPEEPTTGRVWGVVTLLTGAMALSTFALFAVSAVSPLIVEDLGISRAQLGLLTAAGFSAATLLSLLSGQITDRIGGRPAMVGMLLTSAVAFTVLASGQGYAWLLVGMIIAGAAQSFANPTTNQVVATQLPPARHAGAVGVKQSGVQLGGFATGLLLPPLAIAFNWRIAIALVVPVVLITALLAARLATDRPAPTPSAKARILPGRPVPAARHLILYSLGIGTGVSSVNTYLPLYAHQELGLSQAVAGALLAAVGGAGVAARLYWARQTGRRSDISGPLLLLALGAVGCAGLMAASGLWPPLVWAAALGIGSTAVAANAVSMVAVVRNPAFGPTGQVSALVSMGFFGGFVVGPLSFGALTDLTNIYAVGWALVSLAFVISAISALGIRRALRRAEEAHADADADAAEGADGNG